MHSDDSSIYVAHFHGLELKTWESGECYSWNVIDTASSNEVARGAAIDRESAMVAAAQAARADWGSVRWRGADEEEDE